MSKQVSVAMVGLSGYGLWYLDYLLGASSDKHFNFVAGIDLQPERCERLAELQARGVKIFHDMEEFYDTGGHADLMIISTPIHVHLRQVSTAVRHGSNVLCEKPIAATIQDCRAMLSLVEESGMSVSIGYQWSYSDSIQALKADIISGHLGRAVRMKTLINWPRPASYYARGWAGALKNAQGDWILDSPVQNATAHYLHNCFYLLGDAAGSSASPVEVQAELYRANPIENYDTADLRARMACGAEILFYTSHAVPSCIGPVMSYEFEEALVTYEPAASFLARFKDGTTKTYGDPDEDPYRKIHQAIQSVRDSSPSLCDIRSAMPQVLCANGAQESMPNITAPNLLETAGDANDPVSCLSGLQGVLVQCYTHSLLPAEYGDIPWAKTSRVVDLRGYQDFGFRDI